MMPCIMPLQRGMRSMPFRLLYDSVYLISSEKWLPPDSPAVSVHNRLGWVRRDICAGPILASVVRPAVNEAQPPGGLRLRRTAASAACPADLHGLQQFFFRIGDHAGLFVRFLHPITSFL